MLQDFHDRGIYLTEDEYRTGLRALFPSGYQEASDEELEDILYDRIARMSPSEAEGFFSSLGNFFKNTVAPIAIAALPAVATIAGTAIGGPAGAAIGSAIGGTAANAISGATHIRPNQMVSNIGGVASSFARGDIQGAIPGLINAGRDIGNTISPGAGNRVANVASGVAQGATSLMRGNYAGAIPSFLNAVGGAISPGAGNAAGASPNTQPGRGQASSQLLGFLQSTPFLQSMLSSIATGNLGTGLHIPSEEGPGTTTNYLEMLESLKYLTESAIIEADTEGFSSYLPIESEADKDQYLESLIESVNVYENSLLPDYDKYYYN